MLELVCNPVDVEVNAAMMLLQRNGNHSDSWKHRRDA